MRQRGNTRRTAAVVLVIAPLGLALAASVAFATKERRMRRPQEKYELAEVHRTEIQPSLMVAGRVESSKKTVIECELENISIGVQGQRLSAGGASVLLSIVPQGTLVRQGDVLAVLDSSDYEELLRQQRMTVERSRADYNQAELNLEIAKLAVTEFRDGAMKEAAKDFERSVALAESDLTRVQDRLEWTRRMQQKGYAPLGQLRTEEFNYARAVFNAAQERAAYELFTHWTAPKALRVLEGKILGATATLNYERRRLNRNLERLAKLEKQVELCTIRAPHDGFVIYANDERRDIQIEQGMFVRQRQDLMYLPDLANMEVVAFLHESIVDQVAKGLKARVVVEGMHDRLLDGRVTSVAQVPTFSWRSDVRYFDGTVTLDRPPKGILPGMTAQVELYLDEERVLAVPPGAVASEGGREVCYVAHEDGLERREVKLGHSTRDAVEISAGLREGEQVVVDPAGQDVEDDITLETPLRDAEPSKEERLGALDETAPVREVALAR